MYLSPVGEPHLLAAGADRAREIASRTMVTVRDRVGFLPPG